MVMFSLRFERQKRNNCVERRDKQRNAASNGSKRHWLLQVLQLMELT